MKAVLSCSNTNLTVVPAQKSSKTVFHDDVKVNFLMSKCMRTQVQYLYYHSMMRSDPRSMFSKQQEKQLQVVEPLVCQRLSGPTRSSKKGSQVMTQSTNMDSWLINTKEKLNNQSQASISWQMKYK